MFNGTFPTMLRVLQQLKHDHRTIALLCFLPTVLLILLRYVFDKQEVVFDAIGPSLIALFPLITMFLVTSIATQRERADGTLERLMATPLSKPGYLLGYALAFSLMAVIQATIVTAVSFTWLGLTILGPAPYLFAMALLVAVLGVALGLVASALAKTEFQAVQFMPLFILPQLLLCGLLVPRENMASLLKTISDFLPLSYVIEGLNELRTHPDVTTLFALDIIFVSLFVVGSLLLASFTLRRKSD
ncbi:MAG TPA: ABC transporter permease [Candidatus Saccharimonadales bacterium]|nr:ABC transporter permease [Candidatus Saccharimonadales bacterium]